MGSNRSDTNLVNNAERMFQMTFSEEEIPIENNQNKNVHTFSGPSSLSLCCESKVGCWNYTAIKEDMKTNVERIFINFQKGIVEIFEKEKHMLLIKQICKSFYRHWHFTYFQEQEQLKELGRKNKNNELMIASL